MRQLSGAIKRMTPFILAAVMGSMVVALTHHDLMQERRLLQREWQRLTADYQGPIEIVVASQDVPDGVTLESSHLAMASVPEKFAQPYAARSPHDVLGMVTRAPIVKGEQILINQVSRPEAVSANATLSSLLPKGKRAVTVGVDAVTGVGGFMRHGDTVDVLWTVKLPQASQQEDQVVTRPLFQDVEVLAMDLDPSLAQAASPDAKPNEKPLPVTLALTPQQTLLLLLAQEQGKIQLSLRSRDENDQQVTMAPANIATAMQSILAEEAVAEPPKPQQHTVEVFKGLERSVVSINK